MKNFKSIYYKAFPVCLIVVFATLLIGCKARKNLDYCSLGVPDTEYKDTIVISGIIRDKDTGNPLNGTFLINSRTRKGDVSTADGAFRIQCEDGDTLEISYIGYETKYIPVNYLDSTEWNVSMQETETIIIEPAMQKTYSTNKNFRMLVINADRLNIPVDSIVVEIENNSDDEAIFGTDYVLEKKIDGAWKKLGYNEEISKRAEKEEFFTMIFTAQAYILPPHSEREYSNITTPYNKMITSGWHRLSKTLSTAPYSPEKTDTLYTEFEIR